MKRSPMEKRPATCGVWPDEEQTMQDREGTVASREPVWLAVLFVAAGSALVIGMRVVVRLAPAPAEAGMFWNLMPVGALGLFAGARLRSWAAWVVPVAAMLVADLCLIEPLRRVTPPQPSFTPGTPVVYGSFILYVLFGRLARSIGGAGAILGGALAGSLQFFLITNFATWAGVYPTMTYPHTLAGLVQCYRDALPFYKNTVCGDLLYTGLFFGVYHAAVWARQRATARQPA
jgi:hypothetical protein